MDHPAGSVLSLSGDAAATPTSATPALAPPPEELASAATAGAAAAAMSAASAACPSCASPPPAPHPQSSVMADSKRRSSSGSLNAAWRKGRADLRRKDFITKHLLPYGNAPVEWRTPIRVTDPLE